MLKLASQVETGTPVAAGPAGVLTVGVEVEEVVDEVGGGGAEAEAEEGDDGRGDEAGGPDMGQQERGEDEDVLGPLVEPEGSGPGFEGGDLLGEGAGGGDFGAAEGGAEAGGGVGDHGVLAVLEQGAGGGGIAVGA